MKCWKKVLIGCRHNLKKLPKNNAEKLQQKLQCLLLFWVLLECKMFLAKKEALTKEYGKNWVFVVTQAITKQDYEKYGATITRTEVKEWMQKVK
jgi:hypothetical protein